MDSGRGFRGWMAASTVGILLTLVLLAVEKHVRLPSPGFFNAPGRSLYQGASTEHRGIELSIDPGLAGTSHFPTTDRTPIARKEVFAESRPLIRRPPQPAATAVLRAPVAMEQLTQMPLHGQMSRVDQLMEAMEQALSSPIQTASVQKPSPVTVANFPVNLERLTTSPAPASLEGRLPEPRSLYASLAALKLLLDDPATAFGARLSDSASSNLRSFPVSSLQRVNVRLEEVEQLSNWITATHHHLDRLVMQHGLEHSEAGEDLLALQNLCIQADSIGKALTDYEVAKRMIGVAYGLERRLSVWQAVRNCLDATGGALSSRNQETAKKDLIAAIASVEQKLGTTQDAAAWRSYLLFDELQQWVSSEQDIWSEGNNLALSVLSRIHYQRLSEPQKRFLAQPEFQNLAAHLVAWGRDPVDYRQLLIEVESLENDSISRVAGTLASAVQVLRLSDEPKQHSVATALNDHYRNANIRLSVSEEIIGRVLPKDQIDVRPVRQRILGADTAGDSAVRTQLQVKLIPDANAWNIGVGVFGDVVSNTRSTKGPAVFHNLSTAKINSLRYVRLDPMGYQMAAEPTDVSSQDYLRKMSTDFDGLPIIGDFARFLAREQFNQKRGLAQRISRRLIADQADAELDRQLQEKLGNAEREIQQRLVGPLERLNLNPMVVSMSTTAERLSIRYRLANEQQMAANTPRPRAPTDSLLSMQVHQTAINNTIEQIGLSGRTWTLQELYARLGEAFDHSEWEMPDDLPTDITIRFADTRPATVELQDGKLRLTLRIALLRRADRMLIERFIVASNYIPAADGLTAELIRDGVVEIISNRDRLALRVIFAKVFVSNPQIPLIAESWSKDDRSAGLAVSQVEIRDGWLAVAISKADSKQAAAVTARAHELRTLK